MSQIPDLETHDVIHTITVGLFAVMAWLGKKYTAKIEKLEESKVSREDFLRLHGDIGVVRESLDAHRQETNERLDRIFAAMVHKQ